MNPDPYDVLELSPDASAEAIRRAFRRLARDLHPDLNPDDPGAEVRFRMVVEAYRVLADPRERAEHQRSHPYAPPPNLGEASLFQEAGRRWATDGQDVLAVAHLDLVTSLQGGVVDVRVSGPVACSHCTGSGFDPAGTVVTCWTCAGTGTVTYTNRFGESTGTCLTCGGEKSQPAEECPVCSGHGTVVGERLVSVDIPEGAGEGDTITVPGAGGPGGKGGDPGDLLVVVAIEPHPVYTRVGLDLRLVAPVSFAEAVMGAEIRLPTFEGPITITVPAGTQGGAVFAVKGRGVRSGDRTGDLMVTVHITVPTGLTAAQQARLAGLPDGGAGELRSELLAAMDG
jgi:molecular chaperone DnaJ